MSLAENPAFLDKIATAHAVVSPPSRFVYEHNPSFSIAANGCFAALRGYATAGVIFPGAGAIVTEEALSDQSAFNKCLMDWKQPFNVFKGDERTLDWIEFLLSEKSPWRALFPYMTKRDPEYINNAAFIFEGCIHTHLMYNFVLGMRLPWEMPRNFELWRRLKTKIDPAMALYVAMNFAVAPGETIDGKYEVEYPWSCLEESDYTCAGRFILGQPRLQNHGSYVRGVWEIENGECRVAADHLLAEFCDNRPTLTEIVDGLSTLVEQQQKVF